MDTSVAPKDLIGHNGLWSFLMQAKKKGNLGHTLIFFGAKGVGKETFARFFISSFLCKDRPEVCGTCVHCRMVKEKKHPQVRELVKEVGSLSVAEVRALEKNFHLRRDSVEEPQFLLLKDLKNLSHSAVNALLKILEEPPEFLYCIGITREIKNVLPTLRSRAQQLYFSLVEDNIIEHFLKSFLDPETIKEGIIFANGRPGIAKRIVENPEFYKEHTRKYKQIFKEIEEAHTTGKLREKKITEEELIQTLPFIEHIGYRLYRAKLMKEDFSEEAKLAQQLSLKDLHIFLLRILKSYSLLEKNISPTMILDQLYSNI